MGILKAKNQTPRSIQKLFIGSVIVAVLFSLIQAVGFMAMQYSSNPNMSGFVPYILAGVAVPLVMWGGVYATRKNKKLTLASVFEITVVAASALAIYGSVSMLMVFMPPVMYDSDSFVLYQQLLSSGIPLAITILIMAPILVRMRRRKQW